MALWFNLTMHLVTLVGGVAAGTWTFRLSSDILLRLIAGMVAIMAHDEKSRADRALEVLRATQKSKQFSCSSHQWSELEPEAIRLNLTRKRRCAGLLSGA
jgi:hypothetical protein